MKTKQQFKNPITGKKQETVVSNGTTRLTKLGFDDTGKAVYQEYYKRDRLHIAGSLIDSKKFVSF